jgi:hypothetical protein
VSTAATDQKQPVPPETPAARDDAPARARGWRRWTPWVLIVLAGVIALVSALNVFVKREALSTDNWTSTSAKLLENDDVRNALSVYLVNQLYDNVDVGKAISQRLPPRAKPLGPTIAAAAQPALVRATDTFLGRRRVQRLWEEANRRAHSTFLAVVNNKHAVLQTTNGEVVLDLRPLIDRLAENFGLAAKVQEKLPPDAGRIVVAKGNTLAVVRKSVKTVKVLSYFLSFLVLALFALAIYIARGRRRTMLMAAGSTILIVGLLLLVARHLAGQYLVNALTTNPDDKRPINATWAIGTDLLRDVAINAVIYGALTMVAAWIAGPSRPAVAFRRIAAPTMRDHPVVVYAVLAAILLIVLATGPTDGSRIYPLLVLFVLAIVGTQILRRQTAREFPPPQAVLPASQVPT